MLFALGSLLFALGAAPRLVDAIGIRGDAATFFAGSLFFTAAGFLAYREAVDAGAASQGGDRRRFFVCQPDRIDWWASMVQLAGTVFFNLSCGNALRVNLTAQASDQQVWRPDALGSICFLVASALAWWAVGHGWLAWHPSSWPWWVALLNLAGSLAFGLAAVGGYVNPATDQLHNADWSAKGTFVGALFFLVGALLLLPERTTEASRHSELST